MAPITNVADKVPGRIFIGGVVTILAWNIAFESCPRLLLHLGFVVDQLRSNGRVYIRDRIGEDAPLPSAGGRAGLPHLGEEPASALSLCSGADCVVEIVLGTQRLFLSGAGLQTLHVVPDPLLKERGRGAERTATMNVRSARGTLLLDTVSQNVLGDKRKDNGELLNFAQHDLCE